MGSSHNTHSENAKMEQIITEFYAKSLQIILESRSPYMSSRNFSGEQALSSPSSSTSSSSSVRPRDKWFNLALRECSSALENIDLWQQSNVEPMVVDILLVQRNPPVEWDPENSSLKERHPFCWNSDQEEFRIESMREKVIERWIVQYESGKSSKDGVSGSRRSSNSALYKKSILLLRSLYVTVRLLPAYKIFRELHSSSQIHPYALSHRVSSLVEPFARREGVEIMHFVFTPLDTFSGRLSLSVLYRSSLSDSNSEPSIPISPQVITDYVGSPLANPLRRFPSLPMSGSSSSPSSLPFSRHHSWSYDRYSNSKASPPLASPADSDPHGSISNPTTSHRFPPSNLPPHPPETAPVYKKYTTTSYDEYSPTFSPSPSTSLSPPMNIPGKSQLSGALLQSESAPVKVPLLPNKLNLPPSPPLKGMGLGTVKTYSDTGPCQSGYPVVEKSFSLGRDDPRKYSGWKMSSDTSPQVSISRSSSRSFQDDFDETEFPCPFDVDDSDMTDSVSRPESFDRKRQLCELLEPSGGLYPIKISQDAAVGALVHMLKKAPPLRQDLSNSVNILQPSISEPDNLAKNVQELDPVSEIIPGPKSRYGASPSISSSKLNMAKTATDALEELQSYREMKKLLLKRD